MLKSKAKKHAFVVSCAMLSLLLLILSGCDATSDPKVTYQATGSWEGRIDGKSVRGIIAPDGSYQLAVVDANGDFIPGAGEYVGAVSFVDRENNIGKISMTFLHPPDSAEIKSALTFILSGNRLTNENPLLLDLNRTSDANGPAAQADVAGRWSLSVNETTPDITALIVDADGNLSGNDGGNCQYSGTLKLADPAWNIFTLDLIFTGTDCAADKAPYVYKGLAMTLPAENNRRHLWSAANSWQTSGNRTGTFLQELAATINVAPQAVMSILGDRTSTSSESSVLVKEGAAVVLNATGSSDANNDPLSYAWSGTDPFGGILTMTVAPGTESTATFTPVLTGVYTINLTVSDGVAAAPLIRPLSVEWTPDRFVDCTNGTVLDTKTNLLWLQDAGCTVLNQGTIWGVSHAEAVTRVGDLASGVCSLNDNSSQGHWRLPTLNDFSYIVPQSQWSEGNRFANVGGTNLPYYWTADPDPETNWFFVDVSAAPAEWFGSYSENNATAVWPVRAMRSGETCP